MTQPQQQEFLTPFESYVVANYTDRLSQYVCGGIGPQAHRQSARAGRRDHVR
ncbi:MAG: hypothetical protein JO139_04150 [Alphaproteobacteria bacterium]|nr:hypothetical protein [Alphaproteobacteria bacterium]MBV8334440.1 hypothetical protein [Alphaproteobacteria bacterium]